MTWKRQEPTDFWSKSEVSVSQLLNKIRVEFWKEITLLNSYISYLSENYCLLEFLRWMLLKHFFIALPTKKQFPISRSKIYANLFKTIFPSHFYEMLEGWGEIYFQSFLRLDGSNDCNMNLSINMLWRKIVIMLIINNF